MLVSFGFDGVLCSHDGKLFEATEGLLRGHVALGDEVVVVTSRRRARHGQEVFDFVERYSLPVSAVYFTKHEYKVNTLRALGVGRHYDDNPDELALVPDIGVRVHYPLYRVTKSLLHRVR
jgi:hypothetical protein